LFADSIDDSIDTFTIQFPNCERWPQLKELEMEKELVGFYMSSHPLDLYKDTIKYFANVKLENVKNAIEINKPDTTLVMAGLVTSSERFTSKSGSDYGRYRIEDQSGSFDFALFKENYLKLNPLLVPGTQVLVTGIVKERYVTSEDPNAPKPKELRITKVDLLESIMENTNREVRFSIFIDNLNKEKADEFINIIKENKGRQPYSIHFVDRKNNITCSTHPEKGSINAQEIFELLKNADYVTYDLLK